MDPNFRGLLITLGVKFVNFNYTENGRENKSSNSPFDWLADMTSVGTNQLR
jgi:hypothetical protein